MNYNINSLWILGRRTNMINMMDKIFLLRRLLTASMILVAALTLRADAAEIVDRIVAVVNDDIIRLVELNKIVAPVERQIRDMNLPPDKEKKTIYDKRMEILNNLIDEKLADQEIMRFHITVGEGEIDDAIERIKAMNYYTDEDIRKALLKNGLSMDDYRSDIKEQLLRNKLVNLKIKSNIIITRSDIQHYYDQHLDKYGPKRKYMLRNIIMMWPAMMDDESRKSVYARMETVYDQLANGAVFEETAKEYSEASNADDGGELGLFMMDELAENIQIALKTMKPGEFSPIIETDQGYQIFFIDKIVDTPGKALSEVEDEIQHTLYEEFVNEKFQSWIEELRKDAHIQIIR